MSGAVTVGDLIGILERMDHDLKVFVLDDQREPHPVQAFTYLKRDGSVRVAVIEKGREAPKLILHMGGAE